MFKLLVRLIASSKENCHPTDKPKTGGGLRQTSGSLEIGATNKRADPPHLA